MAETKKAALQGDGERGASEDVLRGNGGHPDLSVSRNTDQAALVAEINAEHAEAVKHADKAIEHAKRAGALLLEVKATLEHGAFLPWVDANLNVSRRQCQRYMRAAEGKRMTARAIKNDTVSHFADGSNWLPANDEEMLSLHLEPHEGTVLGEDDTLQRGTVYPVLHVQMAPDDPPHYDVVLLEGDRINFTKKPVLHWAFLANLVMIAGGRPIQGGGNIPMFDPLYDTSDGHRRIGTLPWERSDGCRGFVRFLIDIKMFGRPLGVHYE